MSKRALFVLPLFLLLTNCGDLFESRYSDPGANAVQNATHRYPFIDSTFLFFLGIDVPTDIGVDVGSVLPPYSINPLPPDGVTIHATTGTFSGTPSALSNKRSYTISGGGASVSFSIAVVANQFDPATPGLGCSVSNWSSPAQSCSGHIIASGSMKYSDSPADAAAGCARAGIGAGTCCMFHLYGEGRWYLTDGFVQQGSRACGKDGTSTLSCQAAGTCSQQTGAPTFLNQTFSVNENSTTSLFVLSTNSPTYTVVGSPRHGTLYNVGTSVGYAPEKGFTGTDSASLTASNGSLGSAPATFTFQVNAAPPSAASGCQVNDWNTGGGSSCTGNIVASGSMSEHDEPSYAAQQCDQAGVPGTCCMFHLYGAGAWYLTDGIPQAGTRDCDSGNQEECRAGGACQ